MLSYLATVVHSFEKSSRGIPQSIQGSIFLLPWYASGPLRVPGTAWGPTSHRALYPSLRGTSGIHVGVVSPK